MRSTLTRFALFAALAATATACGAQAPAARRSHRAAVAPSLLNPGYTRALGEWRRALAEPLAEIGPILLRAAADLQQGLPLDVAAATPTGVMDYSDSIAELRDLVALPSSAGTRAQLQRFAIDLADVDAFFGGRGIIYYIPSAD